MSAIKCLPGCTCGNHVRLIRKNRVATTCLECGTVSYRLPCFSDRKFCNRRCAGKFNAREKQRREIKPCEQCGEEFESLMCSGKKFCTHKCASEFRKDNTRVILICQREDCGKEYWRHRHRSNGSKYCSLECKNVIRSERAKARREAQFVPAPMSEAEYERRLALQGGVCAICGKQEMSLGRSGELKKLAKDHCHTTGEWRGLLCGKCNKALGLFGDDPATLRRAIDYLVEGGVAREPAPSRV